LVLSFKGDKEIKEDEGENASSWDSKAGQPGGAEAGEMVKARGSE